MSGIAGIFYRNGKPAMQEELDKIAASLSHRGSDGIRFYRSGSVGLIHFMLNDTPESLMETQPCSSHDDLFTILFDGRIDNRRELAGKINWKSPLHETPDSSLVLAAYQKWRNNCSIHLLGDFAFSIWDKKSRQLFCSRDCIGVKPFYYYLTNDVFIFSSEIKGILSVDEVKKIPDEKRIADFLSIGVTDKESTFYRHIKRLQPGYQIIVDKSDSYSQQYYKLSAIKLYCKTDNEYEEQFRELFSSAISCRLRSVGPIGSFLSGGLDSSSIACVASNQLREVQKQPLHTFSGIFSKIPECDERDYFTHIIENFPIISHTLIVDTLDAGTLYDSMITMLDEPFFGSHGFMTQALFRQINANGIKVVLDGHDGDSAISYGHGLFTDLALSGNLGKLFREIKAISTLSDKEAIKAILRKYKTIVSNRVPVLRNRKINQFIKNYTKLLNPDFMQISGIEERLADYYRNSPASWRTERQNHLFSITKPLHPAALEIFDLLSAHEGVIQRYPFFDKRLIEFCLSIPATQKLRLGMRRSILRRALSNILPETISKRKDKTNFSLSLLNALKQNKATWLTSAIDYLPKSSYKYFSSSICEEISKLLNDPAGNILDDNIDYLFTIAVFSKWLKKGFEQ